MTHPKMRSSQWCRLAETKGLSSAALCLAMKSWGLLAHAGSSTASTDLPFWRRPRGSLSLFTKKLHTYAQTCVHVRKHFASHCVTLSDMRLNLVIIQCPSDAMVIGMKINGCQPMEGYKPKEEAKQSTHAEIARLWLMAVHSLRLGGDSCIEVQRG